MKHLKSLRTDKIRAYEAKYREKMYDWVNRTKNRNRVKDKGLDGDFSVQQWKDCVKKFGGKCANCGKKAKLTYDHKIALSRWVEWAAVNRPDYRANDIQNIQPLCSFCNESKGNR